MIKKITNQIAITIFIIALLVSLGGTLFIRNKSFASSCTSQSTIAQNYNLCDFQGYFTGNQLAQNGYGWALFDTAYGQSPSSTCSSVFYSCDTNNNLTASGFISDIQNYLYSSDQQNQMGAAFIINTMLSSSPNSILYAQNNFSTWKTLVENANNGLDGLSVNFNININYSAGFGNSMYEYTDQSCAHLGCKGDDVFYSDSSSMNNYNSIVFYENGSPIYYIKKNCGNIVGNSKPLSGNNPTYATPSLSATCQSSGSQEKISFSTSQPSGTSSPPGFTPNISIYNTNPFDFAVGMAATPDGGGYWVVTNLGQVYSFGDAPNFGEISSTTTLNKPIVGMAATPDGGGYWLVAADGGVFSFGDAQYEGAVTSSSSKPLATVYGESIVGISSTTSGDSGYYIVSNYGEVWAFGSAPDSGQNGHLVVSKRGGPYIYGQSYATNIVGISTDPTGGIWTVGADGGVFSYNGATFYGSISNQTLNKPIVGMMSTSDGKGYWLVGADGGIFTEGDATFKGSLVGQNLNAPIVGMAATPDGGGYWLVAADGGVFTKGDASYKGRVNGLPVQPIINTNSTSTQTVSTSDLSSTYYIFSNYSNTFFEITGCQGPGGGQTSYNYPYFQVNGSDVSVGMEFCNDNLVSFAQYQWPWESPIVSWGQNIQNKYEPGGQYGVFASGVIDGFQSSLNSTNFNPLALSFSNTSNNSAGSNQFGGNYQSLPSCIYNYYDNYNGPNVTKLPSSSINLSNLGSGSYYYSSPSSNSYTNINLSSSNIASGKNITLYVNGNVTIDGDITYSLNPSKISDISQFKLVVQGNIYISSSVKTIDGIYIAQPTPNVRGNILYSGYIYTCSFGASSIMYQYTCQNNNQLTVNGALLANNIKLLRPYGNTGSTGPAESIDYSPLVWLPNINDGSLQIDKIESLPPVL